MFHQQIAVFTRLCQLLLLGVCSGCAQLSSTDQAAAAMITTVMLPGDEIPLPKTIAETSGLICLAEQQFLMVNDSGHAPQIHQINLQGKVTATFLLDVAQIDWEAITSNGQHLWIGDIGNNSGQRSQLQIHQLPLPLKQPLLSGDTLQLQYPNQPQPPVKPYQHDMDAEALAVAGGQLFMFSKNWLSQGSDVYLINPALSVTAAVTDAAAVHPRAPLPLQKIARIDSLPGLVTDATFSEQHQVFVLTGYANFQRNMLNMLLYDDYRPFIAVLNRQFQLLATAEVPQGGQLEAVCVDQQQMIWLTQEQSKKRPALLWRFGSLSQWLQQLSLKSSQIN